MFNGNPPEVLLLVSEGAENTAGTLSGWNIRSGAPEFTWSCPYTPQAHAMVLLTPPAVESSCDIAASSSTNFQLSEPGQSYYKNKKKQMEVVEAAPDLLLHQPALVMLAYHKKPLIHAWPLTRKNQNSLKVHPGRKNGLDTMAVSPSSQLLAGSKDNIIYVWQRHSGHLLCQLQGLHHSNVHRLMFLSINASPAVHLISADVEGNVCMWSLIPLAPHQQAMTQDASNEHHLVWYHSVSRACPCHLALSEIQLSVKPTQSILAKVFEDGRLSIHNATTGRILHEQTFSQIPFYSVQLARRGTVLLAGSHDGQLLVMSLPWSEFGLRFTESAHALDSSPQQMSEWVQIFLPRTKSHKPQETGMNVRITHLNVLEGAPASAAALFVVDYFVCGSSTGQLALCQLLTPAQLWMNEGANKPLPPPSTVVLRIWQVGQGGITNLLLAPFAACPMYESDISWDGNGSKGNSIRELMLPFRYEITAGEQNADNQYSVVNSSCWLPLFRCGKDSTAWETPEFDLTNEEAINESEPIVQSSEAVEEVMEVVQVVDNEETLPTFLSSGAHERLLHLKKSCRPMSRYNMFRDPEKMRAVVARRTLIFNLLNGVSSS